MSPLLQQVLREINQLTLAEQREVISHTTALLQRRTEQQIHKRRSWRELRGIAPNVLHGQDAQEWVNDLRNEWEAREKQISKGL